MVLCVLLTACYVLLFVSSVVQLLRIVVAQHDVYSFQCGFLLLAVVWSGARAFFFGEWFALPELLSLLLWWLPFDVQLSTFSLLILFYASLLHHTRWYHGSHKRLAYAAVLAVVNVTAPILTTVWAVTSLVQSRDIGSFEAAHHAYNACQLFALFAVFLYHGYKLHSSQWSGQLLSSLLRPLFPLSVLTALCLLVFLSRAIFAVLNSVGLYKLEIGGDTGGWKLVSPVAFVVLLLWEVLPTATVILFFHHIPHHGRRKWQWQHSGCGGCWSTDCGTIGVSDIRGAVAGGDGESERSSSPHSASSRLSYSTADELDAELLQSAASLTSHSFSSSSVTSPSALHPPLQHTSLYAHSVLAHQSSSPATAASVRPSASLSYQTAHLTVHPSTQLLPAPQLSVHQQLPRRINLSSPRHSPLPPPFPAAFSSSFSPPLFASPVVSSPLPSLSASPSPATVVLYGRSVDRWRERGAVSGSGALNSSGEPVAVAVAVVRAGSGRSTAADDDDEYEYRASVEYDV